MLSESRLLEGAEALELTLAPGAAARLIWFAEELLRWNRKVNLTAITSPEEVLEKHLLDCLAVLPALAGSGSLLDLGAGAGLPGIPLCLARPSLQVTLVDAVAKKVGFIKHAIAQLKLAPGARGVHQRAGGRPEAEGLPKVEVVIARALMDLGPWLQLAEAYVRPGGRAIAMLGQAPGLEQARGVAPGGLELVELRHYELPFSKHPRALAIYTKR